MVLKTNKMDVNCGYIGIWEKEGGKLVVNVVCHILLLIMYVLHDVYVFTLRYLEFINFQLCIFFVFPLVEFCYL